MPIANENLKGNIRTTYFEESPIMSTYLVAVVIGAFDYIEETTADGRHTRHSLTPQKRNNNVVLSYCTVRAGIKVTRNQKTAKCSLFWFGKKVFMISAVIMLLKPAFGPHLGTSQLLSHFQNWIIAVSEFAGKAMENHWLIIYRENELLHDDLLSSAASKKRLVIVVSREVARHWFGNLVTMEWWTHLWLNEGFATWVSYMATDIMFPEWKIWSQFLELTTDGLPVDALDQSHPIEVEVHQARTILEIADDISYNKGSAVIRMLQIYLGDHMFQDLQSQFLSSGSHDDRLWTVPITLSIGSYDRHKTLPPETRFGELDLSEFVCSLDENSSSSKEKNEENCDEHLWVKVNINQSGFYRVEYEDKLAAWLRKAVERNYLSEVDKYGVHNVQ